MIYLIQKARTCIWLTCTHFVPNLHLFCANFALILHLFAPNFAPFWPYFALIWHHFAPFCIYLAHICHQFAPILHPFCPYLHFFSFTYLQLGAKSAQNGCKQGQIRREQTKYRLEQFACQKAFHANMKYTEAKIHKFYKSTSQNHQCIFRKQMSQAQQRQQHRILLCKCRSSLYQKNRNSYNLEGKDHMFGQYCSVYFSVCNCRIWQVLSHHHRTNNLVLKLD